MAVLKINNRSYGMSYISKECIENTKEKLHKTSISHYIKPIINSYWISERIPYEDRLFAEEAMKACNRNELALVYASLAEVYLFALNSSGNRSFLQFSVYGSDRYWSIQFDQWEGLHTPFEEKTNRPSFFLTFLPNTR
jgi:hypothetical protein